MNKITKYLYGLMVLPFLALASCTEEEKHVPGEPDLEGCYGVYFPTQKVGGTYDPSADELKFNVKISRAVEKGSITVPLEIIGNEDGYFDIPESVEFADGQAETEFEVSFENAPLGQECSFTVQMTDPEFVSQYSSNASFLTASVIVEKWVSLGKGLFREDMMTTFYNVGNDEYEVEILENANQKGFYRLVYPYDGKYPYNEPGDWDDSKTYYFEIHAEDPEGVWIPMQKTGMSWSYGMVWIGSDAGYEIVYNGATVADLKGEGTLGSLVNGVITFPVKSLLIGMEEYKDFGIYYANNNGMFRVCLPGAILTDYSLDIETGYSSNSVLPVYFNTGTDVASVKYTVVEGAVDAKAASAAAAEIAAGGESQSLDMEAKAVGLTMEASGVYSVVAVGFDEAGAAQSSAYASFNYVTAADEEANAVVLGAGTEKTDRYEGLGHNRTNSIGFYVYGKNLTSVKIGLFGAGVLDKYGEDVLVANCTEVSEEELKTINTDVMTDFFSDLSPNTGYTFVVWATNGYLEKTYIEEFTTDGLPLELLGVGSYSHSIMYESPIIAPYELYRDPNFENTYIIDNWWFGTRFKFNWDGKDKVVVPTQYSGFTHSSYGDTYLVDGANFFDEPTEDQLSKYDAETKTWSFYLVYYLPAINNGFGAGYETFTLDGGISAGVETSSLAPSASSLMPGLEGTRHLEIDPLGKAGVRTGLELDIKASVVEFNTVNISRNPMDAKTLKAEKAVRAF
ncbi:MAG: hypothetical protein ACI3ZM_09190 [Candidatus Cryptobacteroides sp.]